MTSSSLSSSAILVSDYMTNVVTNATVRSLISLVDLNDMIITRTNVIAQINNNIRNNPYIGAKNIVKGYLDKVYFSRDTLGIDFWVEMEVRLKKLTILSLILERLMLASVDARYIPVTRDVPQSLAFIYYYLNSDAFHRSKNQHIADHEAMVTYNIKDIGPLYMINIDR